MNNYQEAQKDYPKDLQMIAKAILNVSEENLLSIIAYLSPFVETAMMGYIRHKTNENDFTELKFRIAFPEEAQELFSYLNYWGDVFEFSVEIFSASEIIEEERIFLEEETYYRTTAREEYEAADGADAESSEHFRVFRSLCLRDSVHDKSASFECNNQKVTKEKMLAALTNSFSITAFQVNLSKECGVPIDFSSFDMGVMVEGNFADTSEEIELNLYADGGDLYLSYSSNINFFENKRVFPVAIPSIKKPQEVLKQHLDKETSLEVKWDFLKVGKPMNTLLDKGFAKKNYPSGTIQIQHAGKWISPCSICINRLFQEVEGCASCSFELIK